MYCTQCGTKNPDGAKFCCNCGGSMNGGSVRQTTPVQKSNNGQKTGFFQRILISLVVFAVFYAGSYAVTSMTSGDKADSKNVESPAIPTIAIQKKETEAAPAPAQERTGYIASLDGYWEDVYLQDGSFNLNVSALSFGQTVYNCTGFTVNMDVTMNAGTNCKDWQVWGRNGNTYVRLAKIYLPAGNGFVSQSLTFASPVTFDSIAVTPTIVGSYSWSMSLGISDVYTN